MTARRDSVAIDECHHRRAVDAEEAREIFLEQLQEQIKADPEEKKRCALLYAGAHEEEFLKWAAERVLDELTPMFFKGWSKEEERC